MSFDGLCEHFTYLKLSVVVRDKRGCMSPELGGAAFEDGY